MERNCPETDNYVSFEVCLKERKDGSVFVIQPFNQKDPPLDVKGVDLGLSADAIVEIVREIREIQ